MKHPLAMSCSHLAAFSLAVALATAASSPQAGVVRAALGANASSTFMFHDTGLLIDQSGLSVGYTSGLSDFDNYLAQDPLHAANGLHIWTSDFGDMTPTLIFDLGSLHVVQGMAVWNSDFAPSAQTDIFGSADGIGFVQLLDNLALNVHGLGVDAPAQRVNWAGQAVRYVQLRLSCTPNENSCGLGEVVFNTSQQVPEPGSLALFAMAALAALGTLRSSSDGRKGQG